MKTKKNVHLILITVVAALLVLITGATQTIPSTGIRDFVCHQFNATDTQIGDIFALFQVGYFIGVILNGYLFKILKPKIEILTTAGIYIVVSLLFYSTSSLTMLTVLIIIMGFGIGMAYTIPNFLIVNAFTGRARSSFLNLTDAFFSVGSFGIPVVAGFIFANNFSWQFVYLSLIIVFAVVIVLTSILKIPENFEIKSAASKKEYSKWNINILYMFLVLFFYLVSYMGFTYWAFKDMTSFYSATPTAAVSSIINFWVFYTVGCFLSGFMLRFIRVHRYILGSFTLAAIAYILILNAHTQTEFLIYISILGLGCSTIFASSISYSTQLIKKSSPILVSTCIAIAVVGTISGQFITSHLEGNFGLTSVIIFSLISMLISGSIFFFITLKKTNNPS